MAELEKDTIVLRTTRGRRQKALNGKVVGQGFAPFGYTFSFETFPNGRNRVNGLAIDPIAEPIVREILARIANDPAGAVAKHLNSCGYPTPSAHRLGDAGAKAWTGSLVINIARSTTYAGAWVYGKEGGRKSRKHEAPVTVDVPAYISMAQYEENRAALLERKAGGTARTQPGLTDRFTLRRMLSCGHCGGRLITMNLKRGKHRYYTCRQHWIGDCPMKMVPAEAIERDAKTILSATLMNPAAIDLAVKNQKTAADRAEAKQLREVKKLDDKIYKLRASIDRLAVGVAQADSGIFFQALMEQAKAAEEEIATLAKERSRLAGAKVEAFTEDDAEILRQWLDTIQWALVDPNLAQIYRTLKLKATVSVDDAGEFTLGTHTYDIEWTAAVPMVFNSKQSFNSAWDQYDHDEARSHRVALGGGQGEVLQEHGWRLGPGCVRQRLNGSLFHSDVGSNGRRLRCQNRAAHLSPQSGSDICQPGYSPVMRAWRTGLSCVSRLRAARLPSQSTEASPMFAKTPMRAITVTNTPSPSAKYIRSSCADALDIITNTMPNPRMSKRITNDT